MNKNLISVIIAAYNAEKYTEECIISIQNQTYTNWEMIICDDCSKDNTVKIIEKYQKNDKRIILLKNKYNIKAGASRNKCISFSKGKYIVIQDADDISKNNRFQMLVERLENKENIDFISSGHYLFDDNGIYKIDNLVIEYPQNKDFLFGIPFCHAATMFKRKALINVGGYRVSKETRRGQDYDLFMRLYAKGYKGYNISDVLYGYRVDKSTINRRKFEYRLDECIIRYKGFKELKLFPIGYLYILKPILAHFKQMLRRG